MKVVLFAGGAATRLEECIGRNYNKHLLPLGKTLVVEKGIEDLLKAGADQFYVITNAGWETVFLDFFKQRLKLSPPQVVVESSQTPLLPLPDVLLQAKDFVGKDNFILFLGDNLFLDSPVPPVSPASLIKSLMARPDSNIIVLATSDEPSQFGTAKFDADSGRIVSFVEKPEAGNISPWVVTGLAKYSPRVFEIAHLLIQANTPKRSLSDIHNALLELSVLHKQTPLLYYVKWLGPWFDIGAYNRYKAALINIWNTAGNELQFDLNCCPVPEILTATLLPNRLEQFIWEMRHERHK